jgi:hypothetical protein
VGDAKAGIGKPHRYGARDGLTLDYDFEAFLAHVAQVNLDSSMHPPTSRWQHAPVPHEVVQAAQRLWNHANGDAGQCRMTARFLLALYNGSRFPFDLTYLRGLDTDLVMDCLMVLAADSSGRSREPHELLGVPGKSFEELANHWGVEDIEKVMTELGRNL